MLNIDFFNWIRDDKVEKFLNDNLRACDNTQFRKQLINLLIKVYKVPSKLIKSIKFDIYTNSVSFPVDVLDIYLTENDYEDIAAVLNCKPPMLMDVNIYGGITEPRMLIRQDNNEAKRSKHYLHLSRSSKLEETGIRCKSADNVIDKYNDRIYLFGIDYDINYTSKIFQTAKKIAKQLNAKLSTCDDFSLYLVKVPSKYPVYKDSSIGNITGFESVWIQNNIPSNKVTFIGNVSPI